MSQNKWVTERRLTELTGLTKDQIKHRRTMWIENRHYKWAADNTLWYNIEEIDKWVENGIAA